MIGRNSFRQKRTINMDLRLSKRVRFGERYPVELLGEAFNIFNHQSVTVVNNTGYIIGSTAVDPVTKAVKCHAQLQLVLCECQ